jgi:hypothetical protein
MIDLYLKGPDQPTVEAALLAAELTDANGNPVSDLVCIDRIGVITSVVADVVETEPGWHCNVRLLFAPTQTQLDALAGVTIAAPKSPFRVWA